MRNHIKSNLIKVQSLVVVIFLAGFVGCASDKNNDDASTSETIFAQPSDSSKPEPSYTVSQKNAIRAAMSYLELKGFSRAGLIKQLSSRYGDSFPEEDAVFAVNHIDVDWNEQAYRAAMSYLELKGFSHDGLVQQLESEYGDGFTHAQAEYGVMKAGL